LILFGGSESVRAFTPGSRLPKRESGSRLRALQEWLTLVASGLI
jgi:hypothetical protein